MCRNFPKSLDPACVVTSSKNKRRSTACLSWRHLRGLQCCTACECHVTTMSRLLALPCRRTATGTDLSTRGAFIQDALPGRRHIGRRTSAVRHQARSLHGDVCNGLLNVIAGMRCPATGKQLVGGVATCGPKHVACDRIEQSLPGVVTC